MKRLVTSAVFLLFGTFGMAQQASEEEQVKQVINTFFEGFHERDSLVMKSVFHEQPVIHSIERTKEGEIKLVNEELNRVLRGIVSILSLIHI